MSVLTSRKVLVLNKNWTPLGTISLQDAIVKLFSTYEDGTPKARIIHHDEDNFQVLTWDDWSKLRPSATDEKIVTANMYFKIPEIILFSKYEKLPKPRVHFSRRMLYKRDTMTCQYCGAKPGSSELTIDHVIPRAQKGLTTWENCVLCCTNCNRYKANRTPRQAGMKLMKEPKKPTTNYFQFDIVKPIKSWQTFIGTAYWEVELENDNQN